MGVNTLTFRDFREYERCPKILAYKTYQDLHRPPRPEPTLPAQSLDRNLIGSVAELAFKTALVGGDGDTAFDQKAYERSILRRLSGYGRQIDAQLLSVIQSTIAGIGRVRDQLVEAYGSIRVLGRGQSRSGLLPAVGKFDFIALPEDGHPVIVELKNVERELFSVEEYQAKFYNALAARFGVMILGERLEDGLPRFMPAQLNEAPAETMLVHARQGSFRLVKGQVDISPERTLRVWEAKQLGLLGMVPETECRAHCPHHRFGLELPGQRLNPALPLPIAFAAAQVELGVDMDRLFLRNYFGQGGLAGVLRSLRWALGDADIVDRPDKAELALAHASSRLGMDAGDLLQLIDDRPPKTDRIAREVPGTLRAWRKLLGKKKLQTMQGRSLGWSQRVFPIPTDSRRFVRNTLAAWHS